MSKAKHTAIENAGEVIERFGGIRPMAKKIDVAVTTVQGWKKRDVIPATRRAQVLEAAEEHDIDLSDVITGAPPASVSANQNDKAAPEKNKEERPKQEEGVQAQKPESVKAERMSSDAERATDSNNKPHEDKPEAKREIYHVPATAGVSQDQFNERLAAAEKSAVRRSTMINIFIVAAALAILLAAFALWLQPWVAEQPETIERLENHVEQLNQDVTAVKEEQSFLSTLIPEDLDDRIAALNEQARETKEVATTALERTKGFSRDVLSDEAGTIEQRVIKLNEYMGEVRDSAQLEALLDRFQTLRQSVDGQQVLDRALTELNALASSFGRGDEQMNDVLKIARNQSTALNQTFEGVPAQDMKAAAMLLGMTQFRQALNRDNQPFEQDLELLLNLTDEGNAALRDSIQKLAPQAESGVLTVGGLTDELREISGDAIVASLEGENVSFSDRFKARFSELFQVEKDGELVNGPPAQMALNKAEQNLAKGDVEGAITQVESLDGPAAEITAPWLEKARATLDGQNAKEVLNNAINEVTKTSRGTLIRDEDTGINIYTPRSNPAAP